MRSAEEIQRKAAELKAKMQGQFVFAPVHGIEVLQLIEDLAGLLKPPSTPPALSDNWPSGANAPLDD